MQKTDGNRIYQWLRRNGRELELARWRCLFMGGDPMDVVNALMVYQNPDGGFAHAVDPDNWNENSLPYATLFSAEILREIGFKDLMHPIYQGLARYLEGIDPPTGWAFTVPSNKGYPHAPFFNHDEEYNRVERLGVILGLSSFILETMPGSKLYQIVMRSVPEFMAALQGDALGDMGLSGYAALLEALQTAGVTGYDYAALTAKLKQRIDASIQRDPKQWASYGYRPSDYIKSPNSPYYPGNEASVALEIDFLAETLPKNGIWPVSWTWFDLNAVYPMEYPVSNRWSCAWKAIEKAKFLQSFGALAL